MDTLAQIKKLSEQISELQHSIFIDSLIIHLERAEYYFKRGDSYSDIDFFNDVIYRTNQAFEGALKEAYKVLANKTEEEAAKEKPFKIEKYLEDNKLFKDRILELFKNYRNEWRNASTHDYKLFFDGNEAFIALTSVSSFVYLLLKQILEKIAYDQELKIIATSDIRINSISSVINSKLDFFDLITKLVTEFIAIHNLNAEVKISKAEIIGKFAAYLSAFPDFNVHVHPNFANGSSPDFLIIMGQEKLILEFKRYETIKDINPAVSEVVMYLKYSGIPEGILVAIASKIDKNQNKIENREFAHDDSSVNVRIIKN